MPHNFTGGANTGLFDKICSATKDFAGCGIGLPIVISYIQILNGVTPLKIFKMLNLYMASYMSEYWVTGVLNQWNGSVGSVEYQLYFF